MSGERARLDAALARVGQTVKLYRSTTSGSPVTCKAKPKTFNPEQLQNGGNVNQDDLVLIMSPTEIINAGWSSGASSPQDTRIPVNGNIIVINGRSRKVETTTPIFVNDELVRLEVLLKG